MMAGKVRMKTFFAYAGAALIACAGIGVGAAALGVLRLSGGNDEPPRPVTAAPVEVPAPDAPLEPIVAVAPTVSGSAPAGARPADQVVLAWLGQKSVPGGKLKDATSGKAYKVNVYQDDGQPSANRAKLDLDRDEKWDEEFTWKDGRVERQVAPADDEVYTETYTWSEAGWVR